MKPLRKHTYWRGEFAGWCDTCGLPKRHSVHIVQPAPPDTRYEVDTEEADDGE